MHVGSHCSLILLSFTVVGASYLLLQIAFHFIFSQIYLSEKKGHHRTPNFHLPIEVFSLVNLIACEPKMK
jgi:hypothetical protein